MRCVFTDLKEVEERDDYHVGSGGMVSGEVIPRCDGADGGHRDCKLWLGGWIFVIKTFQDAGNGQVEGVLGR